jgi:hypothetical protein
MNHPLEQAANIIATYIETLNATKSMCECCGLTKYENFDHAQSRTELNSMVIKLRRKAISNEISRSKMPQTET